MNQSAIIQNEPKRAGVKPFYTDPLLMDTNCDSYFTKCDKDDIPYTVVGLALHLGFNDSDSLLDYAAKQAFNGTIKKAKSRIEEQRNINLVSGKNSNTIGIIFDLKNNFRNHFKDDKQLVIDQTLTINNTLDDKMLDDRIKLLLGETVEGEVIDDESTLYIGDQTDD